MKLIKVETYFVGKDKEKIKTYNFYLKLDSGYLLPIKATFKDGYKTLCLLAETNESK